MALVDEVMLAGSARWVIALESALTTAALPRDVRCRPWRKHVVGKSLSCQALPSQSLGGSRSAQLRMGVASSIASAKTKSEDGVRISNRRRQGRAPMIEPQPGVLEGER